MTGKDVTSKELLPKSLRDFIRLIISFYVGLIAISLFQNIYLYSQGVLSAIFTKSFFLLLLHHSGFTAFIGLFLAFLFNFLERKKPQLGFKVCVAIFMFILLIEGLLCDFYVREYEILGTGAINTYFSITSLLYFLVATAVICSISYAILYYIYNISASFYRTISRMYPFTIILFSLFLATLTSPKKPVNENKTQYLISHVLKDAVDVNKYNGSLEYPLIKEYNKDHSLTTFFDLKSEKPNIVMIMVEGLGNSFVGSRASYPGFTPFLDSLINKSLYWNNFISNAGESYAAIPGFIGSLPFGEEGFTNAAELPFRNTLFSILKRNGFATSFNYGGNSALQKIDRFLYDENVDYILDSKGFGTSYKKQEEDAAGISLGYPDKELFAKWLADIQYFENPRLDVFLTLSTKKPFSIPNSLEYQQKVAVHISNKLEDSRIKKLISKNKELFASVLYSDEALKLFFKEYRKNSNFSNTIFIITGSHNSTDLPLNQSLDRYKVPLIIYSPLLKEAKTIPALVSQLDFVPSILGLLEEQYDDFQLPDKTSWLGQSLNHEGIFKQNKEIPLFRHKNNIKDYISGKHFLSDGTYYELTPEMHMEDSNNPSIKIKEEFKYFKAVNSYVMTNNKIVPNESQHSASLYMPPTKEDVIWINSVFSGTDYDNAYDTAKDLAFEGEYKKALTLSKYILSQVPGHADTEILMGRIYAWQENYVKSKEILEKTIDKYPVYADGYAALLDTYFWSDQNHLARVVEQKVYQNDIRDIEVLERINRAKKSLQANSSSSGEIKKVASK
ncbi:sulfatase-like hydrolase/transferase [Eudoraea chungangensis]|uniref:sulfatase-like hydrolase/transferase n=1 Tax=Eudoraea chungangensis TaxID=1481905 RepID=UPI0023ECA755|nr:sulfatase-like hydrolase/transferase [Eudoraea chungangensis]